MCQVIFFDRGADGLGQARGHGRTFSIADDDPLQRWQPATGAQIDRFHIEKAFANG